MYIVREERGNMDRAPSIRPCIPQRHDIYNAGLLRDFATMRPKYREPVHIATLPPDDSASPSKVVTGERQGFYHPNNIYDLSASCTCSFCRWLQVRWISPRRPSENSQSQRWRGDLQRQCKIASWDPQVKLEFRNSVSYALNQKRLLMLCRCDVGMSLNNGSRPFFFDNSSPREPFPPFPDLKLLLRSMLSSPQAEVQHNPEVLLGDMDQGLAAAWIVMAEFCQVINRTAESQHRIVTETFLLTMASVLYRLLDMTKFKANSIEEVIRLGLLAFSSSVFLQWKQLGVSYNYLATSYRNCLAESRCSNVPPQLLLWLLVVGAVSVFGCDDEKWLRPRLRANIDSIGGLKSWTDVQDVLKSFMWIGLVLDEPGKEKFDSAMRPRDDWQFNPPRRFNSWVQRDRNVWIFFCPLIFMNFI